jgi:hypothetical protein
MSTRSRRPWLAPVALAAAVVLATACGGGQTDGDRRVASDTGSVRATMATRGPGMAEVLQQVALDRAAAQAAPRARATLAVSPAAADASPAYPDLIWRNERTGDTRSWTMDGLSNLRTHPLLVAPQWRLTQVADLNGDGQEDLIWEDASTGRMAAWLMNGPDFTDVAFTKMMLEMPGWKVSFVGDFDGDGRDDLIYYNEGTGQTLMWLMDGLTVRDVVALTAPGAKAIVIGVGDMDGDGRADLLWRNEAGQREVWLMDGGVRRRTLGHLPAAGEARTSSAVPLIARATADRPAALLHVANELTTWGPLPLQELQLVPGTERWTTRYIAPTYPGGETVMQALAAADLAGTGEVGYLVAAPSGLSYLQAASPGAASLQDRTWTVAQVLDLDRDGKDDIIWRDLGTGGHSFSLMDGARFKTTMGPLMGGDWRLTGVRRPQRPPLARIAANPTPAVNTRTVLDGLPSRGRGPGALTYAWTLDVPPGSQARLDDPAAAQPAFTPDVPGAYLARLIVTRQGQRSAATWQALRVPYPAGELTTPLIAPGSTSQPSELDDLQIDAVLTHGLKAGDLLHVEFPAIWGDAPLWLNPGPYGYNPTYSLNAPFEFHALVDRELRLVYRPSGGSASPAVLAAGQRLPAAISLRMRNPTIAGSYVVRLWTSADPTPVSVTVRYRLRDSAPAAASLTVNDTPAPGQPSVALSLTTTNGLPRGSRVSMSLPTGWGVEKLALPMRNATVLAEAGRASNVITYTVLDDSLAAAGSQLTPAQTAVPGPLYTCGDVPDSTAYVQTSEDLRSAVLTVLPPPRPRAITDLSAGSRRDAQGRWVVAPSFRSVRGLPAGATVYLYLQDQVDWTGSPFVPDAAAPCSLSYGGYAIGRTTLTAAVPPNGLVQFPPLPVVSSIQAGSHAIGVILVEERGGGTAVYTEPVP